MKIKAESPPVRCEICHQSDLFDRTLNQCQRCQTLNPYVTKSSGVSLTTKRRLVYWPWISKVKFGVTSYLTLCIFGIISGFTNIDFYLVQLPIDPEWLELGRICMLISIPFFLISFGIVSGVTSYWVDWQSKIFSSLELIIIGFLLWAIVAMALPGVSAVNKMKNMSTTVRVLKKITHAQDAYFKTQGHYASRVEQLVTSPHFPNGLTELESRIGTVGYQGYRIVFFRTCLVGLPTGYEIQVAPSICNRILETGYRSFYLDQTGIIRESMRNEGLANAKSDPIQEFEEKSKGH